MTHATEGLLQAYLDGEIDDTAEAGLREHLAACALCAGELNVLQQAGSQVHGALALLEGPVPMMRAQAALAAARSGRTAAASRRRFTGTGRRSLAKAAMLLLALAGAGAAAIPDSPVRRALETTLARVAQLFGTAEAPVAEAPATVPVPAEAMLPGGMGVMPAENRVRVLLHEPTGAVNVAVRLVDSQRAHVATSTERQGVRFRSAPGTLEVSGLTAGVVTISIPRTVATATIEIGGQVYAYKQGSALQLSGPAGTDRGEQVSFRVGT